MSVELSTGPSISTTRDVHYLAAVKNHPPVIAQGEVIVTPAQHLFKLLRDDPEQQRSFARWNDRLAKVARSRVYSQATEGWDGHTDPDGYGPNWWVEDSDYDLPGWYHQHADANNVESLAHNGTGDAQEVWDSLLKSEGHRLHVLGLLDFYAQQTEVGIGYYYLRGSAKRHYWSIITAPSEQD